MRRRKRGGRGGRREGEQRRRERGGRRREGKGGRESEGGGREEEGGKRREEKEGRREIISNCYCILMLTSLFIYHPSHAKRGLNVSDVIIRHVKSLRIPISLVPHTCVHVG